MSPDGHKDVSTFRKILSAAFFMMLGGILAALAIGLHIVRAPTGLLAIRKTRPALKDLYVDIRHWTRQDWREHPHLEKALVEAGHQDLVPHKSPAAGLLPFNPFRRNTDRRNDAKHAKQRIH
jgi:hypothetical protein